MSSTDDDCYGDNGGDVMIAMMMMVTMMVTMVVMLCNEPMTMIEMMTVM